MESLALRFTQHGRARAQARAVPDEIVDCLLNHGRRFRRHGADLYVFDRRARERLRRILPKPRFCAWERKLNSYVVMSDDGAIVTVGRRTRHLTRP